MLALAMAMAALLPASPRTLRFSPRRDLAARSSRPCLAVADAPDADVVELLGLFSSLQCDTTEAEVVAEVTEAAPAAGSSATMLLPPTQPSSPSIASINAAAKTILASSEPPLAKQDRLAALSERALASGRTRSAQLAFDHALRRWRKWRATKPVPLSRSLLLAGLRSAAARRDKAAYEELLLSAQESWEVDLTHEPRLLSGAMVGCSEAGWLDNARACNMTIVAAGLVPTTEAVNAFMAAQLRAGDTDGVLDAFIHLRQHGPPADRQSQALAMRAAASRKASWNALRNLMRRSWLKIPWNAASANAAVGEFVSTGNLRAAAGVLGHMQSTRMPLRLESLERLLGHTALACGSSPTSLRVFSAMQQHVGALGALAKGAREAGKEEANEKKAEAAGRGVGQGEHDQQPQQQPQPQPEPSAARAAADEYGESLEGLLETSPALPQHALKLTSEEAALETDLREERLASEAKQKALEEAFKLAVRRQGRKEQAEALCAAAAAVGELSAETGVGVPMLEEMILVCGRARDPSAAVLTLRKLEGRASPEAYVSALGTCCADEAPNMALADGVLDMMQGAGALDAATPGRAAQALCRRLRASAVNTLSSAGLQLDQKVAAYLASGGSGKMRGARPVNANDEILSAELGGLPVSTRDAERRAAARGMMVAAWSDADEASYEPAPSEQRAYDEFEKLLAQPGSLPWQGLPDSQVASMKHRVLVEGPWILSDGYLKWTSPKVVAALHALWAEVMRCRGDGREEGRVPVESINYDACLAIMRGGSEEMGEAPFDWEDGAHGGKGANPIFGEPSQGDTVWSP
ncbi:hypothetical protein Ctob_004234 [Chrysochromulina tobinii]|uniref:Pentacotripeptide-repeat region of PRORP domain-containing protein n=1 Tax=Chrysochromulina tobinii TaxID=1460289 RepID=A0A0M0JLY9_9EUKA|nr:hypothetical protein Ctob_004234 [Chrysochromulina tobinii]|eukprot:KOO27480.1 hypothetical protein Ctob_004234 [Chrysochromulina sp. CCMP291]